MKRPARPTQPVSKVQRPEDRHLEVEVTLVTPQFGGGVEARVPRPDEWLRGTAVRGALRSWWRSTTGAKELREREAVLFGEAAAKRSTETEKKDRKPQVALQVCVSTTRTSQLKRFEPTPGDPKAVAYFPALAMGQDPANLLEPGATARLTISARASNDDWKEIERAVQAWLLFGGSGARTRRGAGRLAVVGTPRGIALPSTRSELATWLKNLPTVEGGGGRFARLSAAETIFLGEACPSPGDAHEKLLRAWRQFRQDRPHPQTWAGPAGWGRTRWPEADAVRLAAGTHARWDGGVSHAPLAENRGKAPRAHLGLPIMVKFKDVQLRRHPERGMLQRLDPGPQPFTIRATNRHGSASDRYASPILLTITRLDGGRWHPFVAVTPSFVSTVEVDGPGVQNATLEPGPWAAVRAKLDRHFTDAGFQVLLSR